MNNKIAQWRIDSQEERILAEKADNDLQAKEVYVAFYREQDPVNYIKGLKMARQVINTHRRDLCAREIENYQTDMIYSLHRFGCMFNEYFMFDFEHLNYSGRYSFVTDKIRWEYYERFNDRNKLPCFDDKRISYEIFKDLYNRELIQLNDKNDLDLFCGFLSRHCDLIVKPLDGSGGRDIRIYKEVNITDAETLLLHLCQNGPVVVEELIHQDSRIAAFHNNSLNTVRIPTIRIGKDVHIFHPIFRTGNGDSVTDNTTGGGIFAPVDPTTGIVYGPGISRNGNRFLKHPDSGKTFPGFVLPSWEQALALVKNAAFRVPEIHYTGWDVALSVDGWVMVEGNAQAEFVGWQSTSRTGVRKELDSYIQQLSDKAEFHGGKTL